MYEGADQRRDLFAEIHELAHACLLNSEGGGDRVRLEELLGRDEQARAIYVQYMLDTVTLRKLARAWAGGPPADSGVATSPGIPVDLPGLATAPSAGLEPPGQADGASLVESAPIVLQERGLDRPPIPVRRVSRSLGSHRWRLAFAAAVLCAGLGAWRSWSAPEAAPLQRVAVLQRETGAAWKCNGAPVSLQSGDWLTNGRYTLERGIAQLAFPWGTEVTLEAPADIEFDGNDFRKLHLGQLVAKVAQVDTGFCIDTPAVKVIDLGTEFGVLVADRGASEVHVFKGEVETRQAGERGGQAHPASKLTAGQAAFFGSSTAASQEVIYNPNRFSKAWQSASRVAETRGAVRFVHPAPPSVVGGAFESSQAIHMFLERERITLPGVTAVTIAQPGLYTTFADRTTWLPAGLLVDSFLLHFDPPGESRSKPAVSVEGSVTFDHPIVAVITRGDQLAASDNACASPSTDYYPSNLRGDSPAYSVALRGLIGCWRPEHMVGEPAPNDRVRLSPDRRTLYVNLAAGNETDQIRVLVASDETDQLPTWESPAIGAPQPYLGRPFHAHETIEAEHFDEGGEGIAYFDASPTALASCYRLDSSVEILAFDDRLTDGPDYCTALFQQGEWVGYSVEIDEPGMYIVVARVASAIGGGAAHVEFGELVSSERWKIPRTADSLTFTTVKTPPLHLPAGRHFMRLVMDKANAKGWVGNFDWLRIEPVPDTQAN